VNCETGPGVTPDPSLAVTYHSYFFPRWSPVHRTEGVEPEAALRIVAIGRKPVSPPLRSQLSVNCVAESGWTRNWPSQGEYVRIRIWLWKGENSMIRSHPAPPFDQFW
jgi:hypothetical protein